MHIIKKELIKRFLPFRIIFVFFGLCAIVSGCDKDSSIQLVPQDNLAVEIVDTFEVKTSTILLDSLPTSGKGLILTGNITDSELGNVKSTSYLQVGVPTNIDLVPERAKLDSVKLKLMYNGYYYGDTTISNQISVHEVKERIKAKLAPIYSEPEGIDVFASTGAFYNKNTFNFDPQALGTRTFKPRPLSKDSLFVNLQPALGDKLFALIKTKDAKLRNIDLFLDYFKGLAITSTANMGNSMVGFKDSTQIKLYYSYPGDNGLLTQSFITFDMYDKTFQFNNITADRTSSTVQNLTPVNRILPSTQTANKTFVQGGIGVVTKIEFPAIKYIAENKDLSLNKAELIIESADGTNKLFKLPQNLILIIANDKNKPIGLLPANYNAQLSSQVAQLAQQLEAGNSSSYRFVLTEYLSKLETTYNKTSLFLSLPIDALENSVSRLVVGSQINPKAKIKLKIYYTKNLK